jgi:hypothetical protein
VFFAIGSLIFFFGLRVIKPSKFKLNYRRNCIVFNFVFLLLIYPVITNYAFSMFNCTTVEGVDYLIRDTEIMCWTDEHKMYILQYILPQIIIWVFGYPIIIFILLFRNRK